MPLPATFQEAEQKQLEAGALEYARTTLVKYGKPGSSPWSDGPILHTKASHEFVRHFLLETWPLSNPMNRMALVEWARAGDPVVHEVLVSIILEVRSSKGQMPVELEAYEMEITRASITGEPRRKLPARQKMSNLLRDICIALTVAGVCDRYGLPPTGTSRRRRSACSIVAEALAMVNMAMSEEAVRTIWKKMRGGMPTMPGWAK